MELLAINESLSLRLAHLSKDLETTKKEIAEKDVRIKEQDEEIAHMKSQLMEYEKKVNVVTEENDLYELKVLTKTDNLETQRVTIEVLEKQINAMSEALTQGDHEVERLLTERSRLVNTKFLEFLNDDVKFKEIKLPDYFKHSYNFNYEPFYDQVPKSTFLNPNYNENNKYLSPGKPMNTEELLRTIESGLEDRNSVAHKDEEEKISEKGLPEQGSALLRKASLQANESFIAGVDLQNAFNNAERVRI